MYTSTKQCVYTQQKYYNILYCTVNDASLTKNLFVCKSLTGQNKVFEANSILSIFQFIICFPFQIYIDNFAEKQHQTMGLFGKSQQRDPKEQVSQMLSMFS